MQAQQSAVRLSFSPTGIPTLADDSQPPLASANKLSDDSRFSDNQAAAAVGESSSDADHGPTLGTSPSSAPSWSHKSKIASSHYDADTDNKQLVRLHTQLTAEPVQSMSQPQGDTAPAPLLSTAGNAASPGVDLELTFAALALQSSPLTTLSTPMLLRPTPTECTDADPAPRHGSTNESSELAILSATNAADAAPIDATTDVSPAEPVPSRFAYSAPRATALLASTGPVNEFKPAGSRAPQGLLHPPCSTAADASVSPDDAATAVARGSVAAAQTPNAHAAAFTSMANAANPLSASSAAPSQRNTAAAQSPGNAAAVLAWLNALATPTSVGPSSSHCGTPTEQQQPVSRSCLPDQFAPDSMAVGISAPESSSTTPVGSLRPEPRGTTLTKPERETSQVSNQAMSTSPTEATAAASQQATPAVLKQVTPSTAVQSSSTPVEATPPAVAQTVASARAERTVMSGLTTPASATAQMHR